LVVAAGVCIATSSRRPHLAAPSFRGGLRGRIAVGVLLVMAGTFLSAASGCGGGSNAADAEQSARLVSIGDGRQMVLTCSGEGSPTVMLISGARGAYDDWTHVIDAASGTPQPSNLAVWPQVARSTRVCAYDRPGTTTFTGIPTRSTPVLQPTSAQDGVTDLHALLSAAKVPGPYVLVAHSLGGVIAYLQAAEFSTDVAGLVLVDPASTFLKSSLTPAQWEMFAAAAKMVGDPITTEAHDYERSLGEIAAAPPVAKIPATVLTADKPFDFGAGTQDTWPAWLDAQDDLATLLRARHVTDTDSGHYIAGEQPALVIREILAVVNQLRR
jgi:pimeloyl-ACP methyl ester carboxylesterase